MMPISKQLPRWPRLSRCAVAGVVTALSLFIGGAPAGANDIFAGRKVYDAHCAQCHGNDGRALVAGSPDFDRGTALNLPDSELVRRIRVGRNLMPGYEGILKTKDILNVIAYMRTLRR